MPPTQEPLELVEGPYWTESIEDVGLSVQEADSKLEGVTFEIARIPDQFPYVDDHDLQVARYEGEPPLLVVFEQDPWEPVILLHLVVPAGD